LIVSTDCIHIVSSRPENGILRSEKVGKYGCLTSSKKWDENEVLIKEKTEPSESDKKIMEKNKRRAKKRESNLNMDSDILNIKRKLIQSHMQFNPPISKKTIFDFEKINDIILPEELVVFYTEIANGCDTVDSNDLIRFEELKFDNLKQIKKEFKFTDRWIWENDGSNEINESLYKEVSNGNIVLVDLGCGQTWNIVINGKERGQMWLFSDVGIAPCSPKRNFLTWFEDWIYADGDVSCYF